MTLSGNRLGSPSPTGVIGTLRVTMERPATQPSGGKLSTICVSTGDREMRCPTIITVTYLILATLLSLGGCATFQTLSTFDPKRPMIYSGTRLDWNVMGGRELATEIRGRTTPVSDPRPPFQLCLDTVMLPATINAEIFR